MSEPVIPTHVGLILDGNRRWAKTQGLVSFVGHDRGFEVFIKLAPLFFEKGVKYLTAYAFSTENWKRSKEEVGYLMNIFLKVANSKVKELNERGIKLLFLGRREGLSKKLITAIEKAEALTKENLKGTLGICLNYGGTYEISDAIKAILKEQVPADSIEPDLIKKYLYAPEIPELDIIVRSAGQKRFSNFMLWRAAYAELLFLDKYWPDMKEKDVDMILKEFASRNRRFGV